MLIQCKEFSEVFTEQTSAGSAIEEAGLGTVQANESAIYLDLGVVSPALEDEYGNILKDSKIARWVKDGRKFQ